LISLGNEGTITPCAREGGSVEEIDYLTFHLWAQNWKWYDPINPDLEYTKGKALKYLDENVQIARDLKKPIVLEEFGLSRDNGDYNPNSITKNKDHYYEFIFRYVESRVKISDNIVGVNFWAWAGEGRPPRPGGDWVKGDPLIGDPPHEPQGWYSVYDKDSTIDLISLYAKRLIGFED
jgi:mannan endo-1,4-beta-mannosidase